jgi:hypothetical protein
MKAYIVLECGERHRWDQTVSVAKTGHCMEIECPCGGRVRAEEINLEDVVRHCPECGKRFARVVKAVPK